MRSRDPLRRLAPSRRHRKGRPLCEVCSRLSVEEASTTSVLRVDLPLRLCDASGSGGFCFDLQARYSSLSLKNARGSLSEALSLAQRLPKLYYSTTQSTLNTPSGPPTPTPRAPPTAPPRPQQPPRETPRAARSGCRSSWSPGRPRPCTTASAPPNQQERRRGSF